MLLFVLLDVNRNILSATAWQFVYSVREILEYSIITHLGYLSP